MFKKYTVKKNAKKNASWMAKREAKIVFTALATMATHRLIQTAARKYPRLQFLKEKEKSV